MASRRGFKSDTSFLEKISMGAIATRRVFDHLQEQGHQPLELERGSMSFKIWKNIKIKRIRVPDLLCVTCGCRVESRAKTKLEISMSHSFSDQERGWDYDLHESDFVALVICRRVGEGPVDWKADELVQYVSVRDLRHAESNNQIIFMEPKGAEEGFESRVTWPAAIATSAGTVESVTDHRIQYRRQDRRVITIPLSRKHGIILQPLVVPGEIIAENQVLAAVMPVYRHFGCSTPVGEAYYIERLSRLSLSDRYASAKALSTLFSANASSALLAKLNQEDENIYIKLEAAISLARHGNEAGWAFLSSRLSDDYLQNRLEAVIALGEIQSDRACELLSSVLSDEKQHPEIRSGAAWALGEQRSDSVLDALINSFSALHAEIRIEAARALAKLATQFSDRLVDKFSQAMPDQRVGIAWALSKAGAFKVDDLLRVLVDEDARHWVAYILGTQAQQQYITHLETLRQQDPEVYFAVTVLWKIMASWVYNLEEYG